MKIFVDGIEQPTGDIKNFVIYGAGKILYKYDSFQIDAREIKETETGEKKLTDASRYNDGYITALHLNQPIKRAVKENLTRTDNYTMKYIGDYSWESGKTLYIHESEIAVADIGELLSMQDSDGTRYFLHAVKLDFSCPVDVDIFHAEKIPCSGSWTIPDGGRWSSAYGTEDRPSYDPYDGTKYPDRIKQRIIKNGGEITKGVIKRWITNEHREHYSIYAAFRHYSRIEHSPERKRLDALADRLNNSAEYKNSNTTWSYYTVKTLEGALGYKLI